MTRCAKERAPPRTIALATVETDEPRGRDTRTNLDGDERARAGGARLDEQVAIRRRYEARGIDRNGDVGRQLDAIAVRLAIAARRVDPVRTDDERHRAGDRRAVDVRGAAVG